MASVDRECRVCSARRPLSGLVEEKGDCKRLKPREKCLFLTLSFSDTEVLVLMGKFGVTCLCLCTHFSLSSSHSL